MKKINYIITVFVFTGLVMTSCKKQDVRPRTDYYDDYDFVSKNDCFDKASHATKANFFTDYENYKCGINDVDKGRNVIFIDNITDPNNDEDDKRKNEFKNKRLVR